MRIMLPRVAARIFGEPLAIEQRKLNVIVSALSPRLQGLRASMTDDDEDELDDDPPVYRGYDVQDGIAIIDISGTLVAKTTGMDALSGMTSYQRIQGKFQSAMADPGVSGVLLSIDSPGGEISGLFDLADTLSAARSEKPVCAAVDWGCSAAYLLASCADQIFVSRTGMTGSIGVLALHLDESAADEKAGLAYTAIYAGARKNDGNPHEPLTDEARASIQARVDKVYGMLVSAVASNRGIAESAIRDTQAAVYMGQDGVDLGLADSVGTMDDAMAWLLQAPSSAASAANSTQERQMERPNPADAAHTATPPQKLKALIDSATQQGYASAALVVDLCALAGRVDLAAGFIAAKKNPDEVRAELLKAKAEAEPELFTGAQPRGEKPGPDGSGKAKPWSEVLSALGFSRKKQ